MTLTKTLFVIGCLFAATVAWHLLPTGIQVDAEPRKGRQKWEYGTLIRLDGFPPTQVSYRWIWRTGKKRLEAESKNPGEALSKLNKDLGGEDLRGKNNPVGVLLDQIGKDGWELVTHIPGLVQWEFVAHIPGLVQRGDSQTWTFKRPVP